MIQKVLFFFCVFLASTYANSNVALTFSARDLPYPDLCCSPPDYPPDCYAIIYHAASDSESYKQIGQTTVIANSNGPKWAETFFFRDQPDNSPGKVKVEVFDENVGTDKNMGSIEFRIGEIMGAFGKTLERPLLPSYDGYVSVQGRVNGTLLRI